MKSWMVVAGVVLVAALGVAMFVVSSQGGAGRAAAPTPTEVDEPRERTALEPAADVSRDEPARAVVPSVEATPDEAAAPAPLEGGVSSTARVTGRCVDSAVVGIEGVELAASLGNAKTTSREDGSFELAVDLGQRLSETFRLRLSRDGYGDSVVEVAVRAEETTDLGDLLMRATGVIAGRVTDGQGVAFPQADVQVEEALSVTRGTRFRGVSNPLGATKTNDLGEFRLEDVPAGAVRVWAGATNMSWDVTDTLEVRAGEELYVELEVVPLASEDTIDLVVIDPDGNPVASSQVQYAYTTGSRSGSGSVYTDGIGRCRKFLDVRAPHSFLAHHRDGKYRPAGAIDVPPGTHDLVLQLGEYESFLVRARDGRRAPVMSFTVTIEDAERRFGRSGGTDHEDDDIEREEGTVEIAKPVDAFRLRVDAEGFEVAELGPFDPETMPDEVEVTLGALPAVRGRVLAGGEPRAGARVSLHSAVDENTDRVVNGFYVRSDKGSAADGTTDAEGNFALTLRKGGSYYLRAEASGFAPGDVGPLELDPRFGAAGLEVALERGGTIRGRVIVHPGEEPAGRIVGISRADGFGITQRSDARGGYRFDGLTPGRWLVRWRQDEISTSSTTSSSSSTNQKVEVPWNCEVTEGGTTVFDLDLRSLREAVLVGRLQFDGVAPAGWTATLSAADDTGEAGDSATLDSQGRFRIAMGRVGLCDLVFTGTFQNAAFARLQDTVELSPGENRWDEDLPVGRIEGTAAPEVVGPEASLWYTWGRGDGLSFYVRIVAQPDGSFSLPTVPAGAGRIGYRTTGGQSGDVSVDMAAGGALEVTVP